MDSGQHDACPGVEVWLREPPKCDRLAPLVRELVDEQKKSFSVAAECLTESEGEEVGEQLARQAYNRSYEMTGEKPPRRSYNNGKPRKKPK